MPGVDMPEESMGKRQEGSPTDLELEVNQLPEDLSIMEQYGLLERLKNQINEEVDALVPDAHIQNRHMGLLEMYLDTLASAQGRSKLGKNRTVVLEDDGGKEVVLNHIPDIGGRRITRKEFNHLWIQFQKFRKELKGKPRKQA